MQSIVTLSDVAFEFPNGRTLFQHLNLSLDSKLAALVGPNGVGKTTLAKIMANKIDPSSGMVKRLCPLSFFHQREQPQNLPVYEYLMDDYSWSMIGEKLLEGIDRDLFCASLSGGQWMRVRLARIIKDQFLILDEPTNDLDREGREALFEFLKSYKFGVLIISHDRECLSLCDTILELSNQGLSKYSGGWNLYEEAKNNERHLLEEDLVRAKRKRDEAEVNRITLLEKQEKRNRKGKESSRKGGLPKILLGRRKQNAEATSGKVNSQTLAKAQENVSAAFDAFDKLKIDPLMYTDLVGVAIPQGKLVAQAENFNLFYKDWVYKNSLNFSWRGNIRVAVKGENGSGKSTLVRSIVEGKIKTGNLKTIYLDQQCSALSEEKSVFDNVRIYSDLNDKEIRNALAKLLFFGDSVFQPVHTLSGGERLRAALACGLLAKEKPELLILDEPTNNLDLGNIRFLEQLVSRFAGAVIIVSHDEGFLKECGVNEDFWV